MKSNIETWSIDKLMNANLPRHPFSRRIGLWNEKQNNLLIDSIYQGFYITPICLVKENDKYSILDGVQRIMNISLSESHAYA